jgi:hypothetical protein
MTNDRRRTPLQNPRAHVRRAIRNLDQIQNSSTAHACIFDQSKIDIAKDAIHEVVEELEARAESA